MAHAATIAQVAIVRELGRAKVVVEKSAMKETLSGRGKP
jgi:hypothetical protein